MDGDWSASRVIEWMTRVFQAVTRGPSLFDPVSFQRFSDAVQEGLPHDRLSVTTYDLATKEARIAARGGRDGALPPPSSPTGSAWRGPAGIESMPLHEPLVIDDAETSQHEMAAAMQRNHVASLVIVPLSIDPAVSRAWLTVSWREKGAASRAPFERIERIATLIRPLVPAAHDHARASRLAAMLDRVPHAVLALDSQHRVLEANRAAQNLFATDNGEMFGRSFESMLRPSSQTLFRAILSASESAGSHVLEAITRDGGILVDAEIAAVTGDPVVVRQVYLQDARRRIADEAELEDRAEALAFLRELAEHVAGELNAGRALERVTQLITTRSPVRGVAMARVDGEEGKLVLVAAQGISRAAVDALLSMRADRAGFVAVGDGTAEITPALQTALGPDRPSLLVPLRHADQLVGMALFSSPARISNNTRELLVAGARTIAIALHASIEFAEVARLAAERRQLLDSIPSMVFRLDPRTGATVYANAAVESVLGTPVEEAVGRPGIEGLLADADECFQMAQTRSAVAQGGESVWIDRRFSHREGKTLVLRTRLYVVRTQDAHGHDDRVMIEGIAQDVTDEMEARKQLVQADRLASLGMLAAGVAHEINNPTAFISLGVQQLGRMIAQLPEEPEGQRRRMAEIVTELADGVQRIVQIVGELKLFARIPESAFSTPVDVNRLITSAVTLARSELRNRARVEVELGDLPPLPGDHARLGQVFVNLLINAAQAIPPGNEESNRITVRTRAFDGYVQVDVSDTGVGISRENLGRIFDPFFTTKAPGEGTGLGLAISFDLVKRAGGTIDVQSTLGEGTTFCVKLPVRQFVPPRGSRPQLGTSRPGGRVLVVEDEHHLGVAVARVLASLYMVELAADALTALERIETGGGTEYDAVLCDLRMPGMDGKALYEAVQTRWPAQAKRFIFLTGAGFGGEFEPFIRGTDRPVVEKPFEMEELEDLVARVVAGETAT